MYYEEKMIGGVLKYKTMPDGKWTTCTIESAFDKITVLEMQIIDLKACLRSCLSAAKGGLDQYS